MAMHSDLPLRHMLDLNWHQIKIDNKKFSYKSKFDENSYELLLFNLDTFRLFHLKQDEHQILKQFKVEYK